MSTSADDTALSPAEDVQALYDESAEWYAEIMDAEIGLPLYADTLGRLAERIRSLPGPVLDTSCGPGHMLRLYHDKFDGERALVGMDLSPKMVSMARKALGPAAEVLKGDMRDLTKTLSGSTAAVVSFFALHHLDAKDAAQAVEEWSRVLKAGGQLVVATWEGSGHIDYGDTSDVLARRYSQAEVDAWIREAGFTIDRSVVEPVEDMPMDAIYVEATRP